MGDTLLLALANGDGERRIEIGADHQVTVDGQAHTVVPIRDGVVRVDGQLAWTATDGDATWVFFEGRAYQIVARRGGPRRHRTAAAGSLMAPMPATVRRVLVAPGDRVKEGDTLIVLEAMKMELPIRSTATGTVRALRCAEGDMVQPGVALVEIDAGKDDA